MLKRFYNWLIKLLTDKLMLPHVPVSPIAEAPHDPIPFKVTLDKEVVCEMLVVEFIKLCGNKEIGPNRSPLIDKIVSEFNGTPGEPYCAYTCSYVIEKVCIKLEIDYPKEIYQGGSSQGFLNKTSSKYAIAYPQEGALFILTNRDDSSHGHVGLCRSSLSSNGVFETVEANTQNQIMTRADRTMSGPITKKLSGFSDVAQAILDQWNIEHAGK